MNKPNAAGKPQLSLIQTDDSELDVWLAELAEKKPMADHSTQLLKEAIIRSANQANSADQEPATEAHAWQRLQFRLRQEGLAQPHAQPQRKLWLMAASIAALGLCAALAWHLIAIEEPAVALVQSEPPQWREADAASPELNDEPKQAAQRMASALAGKGTVAKVYEFRGKYVVEFKAESERLYEIQRASGDMGLRTQIALGKNRVVFTRKAAPVIQPPAKSASQP